MKFSNYLKSIEHIDLFPIVSLVLFMVVFLVAVAYTFKCSQQEMNEKANIPLQ